mgnify:CR=1 FL=1
MSTEKKQLVPELRFPEFENDEGWKIQPLGEIGKPLMCKRILKEQTTTNSKNAIPFYKIGTFGRKPDAFIPLKLYNEYKKKYSFPNIGDILISASGTIGRLVVFDGVDAYFQDSNIVWIGNDETQIINTLLYYCYSNLVWQTSDGGVIKRLYNSNLKEIEIYYPKNTKEQQKIAYCLTSLDHLITAETEKLDHLKDHKKGLLQQLFPANGETKPQYRFPEFEDDGDWVETTLDNCLDYLQPTPYLVSSTNYDDEFETPVLTAGKTFILGYTDETEGIFKKDLPVIIFDDFTTATKFVDFHFKVKSSAMKILLAKSDNNIKFLFETIQNLKFEVSTHKRHWISIYSKLNILKPKSSKEQQKIADCFSSVDNLIESQTQKVKALKKHKKGLMQKLFPKVNELAI